MPESSGCRSIHILMSLRVGEREKEKDDENLIIRTAVYVYVSILIA
jgi:hypothetical protein